MPNLARVFSGIQPTGIPHLGNYFGALQQWVELANTRKLSNKQNLENDSVKGTNYLAPVTTKCDIPIFCIVDVHAYSSPAIQYGAQLYRNILDTTASLLAIGLNPNNSILFRQSDVLEHNYLDNVLHNFVTTQRLSRMTQYKEKSSKPSGRGILNGLLTYPVLQAADILVYNASLVPIGDDQRQHIELTRGIAESFNKLTSSQLFNLPQPLFNKSEHARRVKSLREPDKKMSKSASYKNSFVEIVDKPDVILEKVKKAMTDNTSEVYYDADMRPGVSNLMRLHHLSTGETFDEIRANSVNLSTAQYKLRLAEILIEKFRPMRTKFERVRNEKAYLEETLKVGRDAARPLASEMVRRVKSILGSTDSQM